MSDIITDFYGAIKTFIESDICPGGWKFLPAFSLEQTAYGGLFTCFESMTLERRDPEWNLSV